MIFARLALVWGVPAIIVAVSIWLGESLYPRAPGEPYAEQATYIYAVGGIAALAAVFGFHILTRHWRDW